MNLTRYRAYNPNAAKWLARDPLPDAERSQGPNLYQYVSNDPVDLVDPLGLAGNGGKGYGSNGQPLIPPVNGGQTCPCGQHFGFIQSAFNNTRSTLTGGTGGALTGAAAYGYGLATGNTLARNIIGAWTAGVTVGAAISPTSWGCVPN